MAASDEKPTAETLERLNSTAEHTHSSASVFISQDGEVLREGAALSTMLQRDSIFYGEEAAPRILFAGIQSHAISTGNEVLYREYAYIGEARPVPVPDVTNFRFNSAIFSEFKRRIELLSTEDIAILVKEYLDSATEKLSSEDVIAYTPYLHNSDDPNCEQITITAELKEFLANFGEDIESFPGGEFKIEDQREVIVTDSLCRAHELPISIPVSFEKSDVDSGNCDTFLNTSFSMGDKATILASYKEYVFISGVGRAGWVRKSEIAFVDDAFKEKVKDAAPCFYTAGKPLFYRADQNDRTLLPGDLVYRKEDGYYVSFTNDFGNFGLAKVAEAESSAFKENFQTPKDMLDFLYGLRVPYMWANFDCSAVIDRAFRAMGVDIPKYSGDIMEFFLRATSEGGFFDENSGVVDEDGLRNLEGGIYLSDIQRVVGSDEERRYISDHIYVLTVKDGKFEAWSQGFRLRNGEVADGEPVIDVPVGPYVNGIEGILSYMNDEKNPRIVRIVKVGGV